MEIKAQPKSDEEREQRLKEDREQRGEKFKRYLKTVKSSKPDGTCISDETVKGYLRRIKYIDKEIQKNPEWEKLSLLDITDLDKYKEIQEKIEINDSWTQTKTCLKHYGSFLKGDSSVTDDEKRDKTLQKIYFGTPGSGKSHTVKDLTGEDNNVFRTTFHPDSDYASFVGCYKPVMTDSTTISYKFVPQVFTNAYVYAWKNLDIPTFLVIEEINRGNCAQIFGDLFQLLDRDQDGKSTYPIKADHDLVTYLKEQGLEHDTLRLPSNLHILATMNTSDQSLFPMDSAFKRRWDWEYVPVSYDDTESDFTITIGEKKYAWLTFLKAVNEKILSVTQSEDKQMGNFFIKNNIGDKEFKSKVMFYLWSEVCKEEYGTQNNFFRTDKRKDGKEEKEEFTFNNLFYKGNGTALLEGFMKYLGVPANEQEGTSNKVATGSTQTTNAEQNNEE